MKYKCKKCKDSGTYLVRLPDDVGSPNTYFCDCTIGKSVEAQVYEGIAEAKAGNVRPWEDIKKELGL